MTSGSENVSVRQATSADARAIAQAHVDSWRAAYPGLIPERFLERLSLDRRERQWAETLAAGEDKPIVLVAESLGGRRPSQYFPDAGEVVEVRFRRAL
jgi:hypothetical protein